MVKLGQGQTVGADHLMVFHDASPITINYVAFTSVTSSTNDEWIVPDEFVSGPGDFISCILVNCFICCLNSK